MALIALNALIKVRELSQYVSHSNLSMDFNENNYNLLFIIEDEQS